MQVLFYEAIELDGVSNFSFRTKETKESYMVEEAATIEDAYLELMNFNFSGNCNENPKVE